MYKTTIKSIKDKKETLSDNGSQNTFSITFEVEHNGHIKSETITLVGTGTLKSAALV